MKKALLVVSFGTSYHDTREKNIVACERDLAASCPDRDLFRAFTSGMIIRKLKQRDGIEIDTPLQALQKLAEQGYQDVAIQSLHIINGDEYEKIVREVQSMRPLFSRLTLGVPLLSSHEDYAQLMLALLLSLKGVALMYMGEELGLPDGDLRRDQLRDPVGERSHRAERDHRVRHKRELHRGRHRRRAEKVPS